MIKYLYLVGEVNFDSAGKIISEILDIQHSKTYTSINLFITSGGGYFYPAFALYDIIQISKIPITTIATGYCASCAIVILQAGKIRKATENTVFMLHNSSNMIESTSFSEFNKQAEQYQIEHQKFLDLSISKSKLTSNFFKKLNTSYYFDTNKALEFSLIDEL